MTIGVVSFKMSVINPENAFCMEPAFQLLFNLLLCERLVTVGSQQTIGGGEYRSLPITLNAATFEYEVEMIFVS